jgi:hypothetical protein
LAFLAMESGKVPQQFAVILLLDRSDDLSLSDLQQVISDRILAVPRLRQRLIKVPPGCGRSVWVDEADFTIDRDVSEPQTGAAAGGVCGVALSAIVGCHTTCSLSRPGPHGHGWIK